MIIMNKMVICLIRHPKFRDVTIKGLIDADILLDRASQEFVEGIIQYYQADNLRWEFPVNQFMKHSIKWNAYEELKDMILANEKELACEIFKGDKTKTFCSYKDMKIDREVLTW